MKKSETESKNMPGKSETESRNMSGKSETESQNLKSIPEKLRYYWQKAWAPTVVVTIVYFMHFFFFGQENTIIGPFVTLTFLRLRGMESYRDCMIKNFAVYSVMAVLSFVALQNPVCNILVNALALFWIAYFLIDEYQPRNYFPAGMALIFFQIAPADGIMALGRRILALAAAFLVVFLFLLLLDGRQKQKGRMTEDICLGNGLCRELCDLLKKYDETGQKTENRQKTETGQRTEGRLKVPDVQDHAQRAEVAVLEIKEIRRQLYEVCLRLSREIYHCNRSEIGRTVAANRYCDSVCRFYRADKIAGDFIQRLTEGKAADARDCADRLSALMKAEEEDIRHSEEKLKIRFNRLDMRSFRLRFALRQVCVLTPCLVFGYMGSLPNRYWLAISVFFMMIPLYERTFGRIAQRMKGTLAGLILCIGLFAVCQTVPMRMLLMTVFNFLIYCSGGYTAMVTCITCSALALNFSESNYLVMLAWRMGYTVAGALVAWAANTWVFPIRAAKQMKYLSEMTESTQKEIRNLTGRKETVEKTTEKKTEKTAQKTVDKAAEKTAQASRFVIRYYLLKGRMADLQAAVKP